MQHGMVFSTVITAQHGSRIGETTQSGLYKKNTTANQLGQRVHCSEKHGKKIQRALRRKEENTERRSDKKCLKIRGEK